MQQLFDEIDKERLPTINTTVQVTAILEAGRKSLDNSGRAVAIQYEIVGFFGFAMPTTTIGIPVKLLHEAEGHIVTVELVSGETYRGLMKETEDTMNVVIHQVTATSKDGKTTKLQHVYIRGSKVRFFIFPDMLVNSPMFVRDPKTRGSHMIGP